MLLLRHMWGKIYYKSSDQTYDSYPEMLLELAIWTLPSLEVMLDLFTDHKDVSKTVTYVVVSRVHGG